MRGKRRKFILKFLFLFTLFTISYTEYISDFFNDNYENIVSNFDRKYNNIVGDDGSNNIINSHIYKHKDTPKDHKKLHKTHQTSLKHFENARVPHTNKRRKSKTKKDETTVKRQKIPMIRLQEEHQQQLRQEQQLREKEYISEAHAQKRTNLHQKELNFYGNLFPDKPNTFSVENRQKHTISNDLPKENGERAKKIALEEELPASYYGRYYSIFFNSHYKV